MIRPTACCFFCTDEEVVERHQTPYTLHVYYGFYFCQWHFPYRFGLVKQSGLRPDEGKLQ